MHLCNTSDNNKDFIKSFVLLVSLGVYLNRPMPLLHVSHHALASHSAEHLLHNCYPGWSGAAFLELLQFCCRTSLKPCLGPGWPSCDFGPSLMVTVWEPRVNTSKKQRVHSQLLLLLYGIHSN